MIVRDTAGQHYRVTACDDPALAHVWMGTPVKRSCGAFAPKAHAKTRLVRRAGCVIVAQADAEIERRKLDKLVAFARKHGLLALAETV